MKNYILKSGRSLVKTMVITYNRYQTNAKLQDVNKNFTLLKWDLKNYTS